MFPSLPRFICYFFDPKRTNSDPISTNFSIKKIFVRFGSIFFSMFRYQFFINFHYFYSFSAPKKGVQSIPRVIAVLMVFFSSKTDKISPNFDHFFTRNSLFPTFGRLRLSRLALKGPLGAAEGSPREFKRGYGGGREHPRIGRSTPG